MKLNNYNNLYPKRGCGEGEQKRKQMEDEQNRIESSTRREENIGKQTEDKRGQKEYIYIYIALRKFHQGVLGLFQRRARWYLLTLEKESTDVKAQTCTRERERGHIEKG